MDGNGQAGYPTLVCPHTPDPSDEVHLGAAPGREIRDCDSILVLASAAFDICAEIGLPALVRSLSRLHAVYVVRGRLEEREFRLHALPFPGVHLLDVSCLSDRHQHALINEALCEARKIRPLLLTDDPSWSQYVSTRYSARTIFYLTAESCRTLSRVDAERELEVNLRRLLARTDLVVAPSPLVSKHLEVRYGYDGDCCLGPLLERHVVERDPGTPDGKRQRKVDAVAQALGRAAADRYEVQLLQERFDWVDLMASSRNGPAGSIDDAVHAMQSSMQCPPESSGSTRLNIIVYYDDTQTHIATLREYLESYAMFSRHSVHYAAGCTTATAPIDLSLFDVVVLHYSIRISLPSYISPELVKALRAYGGYKILYMQDDYETTEQARRWIETLGIHTVYTCVLRDYHEVVFPLSRFPAVEFIRTLTGYVPLQFDRKRALVPVQDRKTLIGYRGRALPYWYGNLGQEKFEVGRRMREICDARGLPVDIEWDDSKRIYGDEWYRFHERVRAVLGSESGSNVFDDEGEIRASIEKALKQKPDLCYEEAFERFVKKREGQIVSAQISPRVFEAISLGAALVLFEGRYDNIIKPGVHYISLKKDFSNVDEVLGLLQDDDYLTALTQRAYEDIVLSGRYSYRRMVEDFDDHVVRRLRGRASGYTLVTSVVAYEDPYAGGIHAPHASFARGYPTNKVLSWFRDAYDKYPDSERSQYYVWALCDGEKREWRRVDDEKRREKWILKVPGAVWIDERVCKPFHRVWEHHRKRLLSIED